MPLLQAHGRCRRGLFREVKRALETEGSFLRVDYQPLESSFDLMETIWLQHQLDVATHRGPRSSTPTVTVSGTTMSSSESSTASAIDTDNDGGTATCSSAASRRQAGFDRIDGNKPQTCCPDYGFEAPAARTRVLHLLREVASSHDEYPPLVVETGARSTATATGSTPQRSSSWAPTSVIPTRTATVSQTVSSSDCGSTRPSQTPLQTTTSMVSGRETRFGHRATPRFQTLRTRRARAFDMRSKTWAMTPLANRHCYNFEINSIELVTTLQVTGARRARSTRSARGGTGSTS